MRKVLSVCQSKQLKYRYALSDNWFASSANMKFIRQAPGEYFIFSLKSNRTIALRLEDRKAGKYAQADSPDYPEKQSLQGWIKKIDFPDLIHRQYLT